MEVLQRKEQKTTRKFQTWMILRMRIAQPEMEKSEGRHGLRRKMSHFHVQHVESQMTACSGRSRVPCACIPGRVAHLISL